MTFKPTMNVWVELQEPDENYNGEEIAEHATRIRNNDCFSNGPSSNGVGYATRINRQ